MFVADESVQNEIIRQLRKHKYSVYSIQENHQGIRDHEVLEIAVSRKEILITEDKDFGDLAFKRESASNGIILIRLSDVAPQLRPKIVFSSIQRFSDKLANHFVVISSKKTRIRAL